jgi:hypothetical protein
MPSTHGPISGGDVRRDRRARRGAAHWGILVFLIAFVALLLLVSFGYLIPAMDAARTADRAGKFKLVATSRLLLAVVLFVLFMGLMMTFNVRRFFFPRETPKRTRTQYVDAWTEAGKRVELDDDE